MQRTENGRLYLSQRNRFFAGDTLEILMPGTEPPAVAVTDLRNGDGAVIETANHAAMDCSFRCDVTAPAGVFLRKRIAEA